MEEKIREVQEVLYKNYYYPNVVIDKERIMYFRLIKNNRENLKRLNDNNIKYEICNNYIKYRKISKYSFRTYVYAIQNLYKFAR